MKLNILYDLKNTSFLFKKAKGYMFFFSYALYSYCSRYIKVVDITKEF
jgi:hypothetical protein